MAHSLTKVEILYKDKALFDVKKARLVAAGIDKLQVIADFDRTISGYHHAKWGLNQSCHGVVESYSKFPPSYKEKSQKLFEKYFPIETSHDTPFEIKYKMCEEWWGQAHDLLLEYKVSKHDIEDMCIEADVILRDKVDKLFQLLNDKNVPCLVFSAGLADILEEVLRANGLMLPNTHVISNRLIFNEEGIAVAFDSHIIHSLNKNEAAARDDHPYWAEVAERPNVLLLGDSLTDMQMSEGVAHKEEQIAVGFLNDLSNPEKTKLYLDTFDVLITNDGPFDYIIDLVLEIIGQP